MFRKDYLVRQFEEFGKVMAVILGFKQRQDWDKFHQEIDTAARRFTSLEIDKLDHYNREPFEKEILLNTDINFGQHKMAADLLFEKLSFYLVTGNEEKTRDLIWKCRKLYEQFLHNLTENEFNLDVHYRLSFLNKLEDS